MAERMPYGVFMARAELDTLAGNDLARFILMFYRELPDSWYEAHFRASVIGLIKADAVVVRTYWFNTFGGIDVKQNSVVS